MKTAILSWGSLIESGVQRGLRIVGEWRRGGPLLPIEFSRISQSGNREKCLTLVIDEENGCDVPTQYAISTFHNLDFTLINLRLVENIRLVHSVGYINLVKGTERGFAKQYTPLSCERIKEWARRHEVDAVVWTSLLPNFEKISGMPFTVDNAVRYVKALPEPYQSSARSYILKSPMEVLTPVKTILIRNWMNETPPSEQYLTSGENCLMRFVNRFRFRR